jgi:hypothetical protein
MGGQLILRETILELGKPSPKRLTFEVRGFNAKMFIDSFGFGEIIQAEGIFDGVLPMVFDDAGGRIVGGRLDSRAPGGRLAYGGTLPADIGTAPRLVINAIRDLRFRSMIIRLDGDLAGEFGTRLTIDGVSLSGANQTQRLIARFAPIPLKLNVSIRGPFRALIATAKSLRDPAHSHRYDARSAARQHTRHRDGGPAPRRRDYHRDPDARRPRTAPEVTSMTKRTLLLLPVLGATLAGCVNVRTPERPIEINLNVAIRQEVLVRMQRDVDTLIEQNPQAFPQRPATPGTPGQR